MKSKCTHIDQKTGLPTMVDIGGRRASERQACAQAVIRFPAEILNLQAKNPQGEIFTKKGPVIQTAIIAGTLAVKNTSQVIPFCHPLPVSAINFVLERLPQGLSIQCQVKTSATTGVEMEALHGASVAALTVYDMCKSLSHHIVVEELALIQKSGGKRNFSALSPQGPLLGLVLAGGRGRRLGQDKSALNFFGKPQVQYQVELLEKYCQEVFISCRPDQISNQLFAPYKKISDVFVDCGPLGGILSAMRAYPQGNFLVLACDMPMVSEETLATLIKSQQNDPRSSFAFDDLSQSSSRVTPLCALYTPEIFSHLWSAVGERKICPQKILRQLSLLPQAPIKLIESSDPWTFANINTPQDYSSFQSHILKSQNPQEFS